MRLKAARPRAGRCASSCNCWLGISTVDAYLAYKRFCPGKDTVSQDDFVLDVIGELLDNTFGVAGGRVLRARPADDEPASSRVRRMHDMRPLMNTEHFTAKRAAHEENGRHLPQARTHES